MANPYQAQIDQINQQYDAQLQKLQAAHDAAAGGINNEYNTAHTQLAGLTHDSNVANQQAAAGINNTFGQAVGQQQALQGQIQHDLGQYGAYTPALADEAALRTQGIRDAQSAQSGLSQRFAQMIDQSLRDRQAYSGELKQGGLSQLENIFTNNKSAINLGKTNAMQQLMAAIAKANSGGGGGRGGGGGGSGGLSDSALLSIFKADDGTGATAARPDYWGLVGRAGIDYNTPGSKWSGIATNATNYLLDRLSRGDSANSLLSQFNTNGPMADWQHYAQGNDPVQANRIRNFLQMAAVDQANRAAASKGQHYGSSDLLGLLHAAGRI